MPHIDVLMYSGRSDETKLKFAEKLQRAAAAELGIDETVVSVSIKDVEKEKLEEEINKIQPENMFIKPGTKLSEAGTEAVFPLGEPNDAYAEYFIGKSYIAPLVSQGVPCVHVTFEPGCRNNWHIHHGGGQILLVTGGSGWYQEWGSEARKLKPGDSVYIAPELKHWHGAASNRWFSHIAIEIPSDNGSVEWLEAVDDTQYEVFKKGN